MLQERKNNWRTDGVRWHEVAANDTIEARRLRFRGRCGYHERGGNAMSELPTPPDAQSVELLRVWIVRESLQCSIQADAFPDPGTWGAVLADVVRYVASAWQQQEGVPAAQTTQRILNVLAEEMRSSPGENEAPAEQPA